MDPGFGRDDAWIAASAGGHGSRLPPGWHAQAVARERNSSRHGNTISAHNTATIATTHASRNGHGPRKSSTLGLPGSESPRKPKFTLNVTFTSVTSAM